MFCTLIQRQPLNTLTVHVCKHHETSAFPTTSVVPVCQERALGAMRRLRRKTLKDSGTLPARCEQQAVNGQVRAHLPLLFSTQQVKGNMGLGSLVLEKVTEGRGAQCDF